MLPEALMYSEENSEIQRGIWLSALTLEMHSFIHHNLCDCIPHADSLASASRGSHSLTQQIFIEVFCVSFTAPGLRNTGANSTDKSLCLGELPF